MKNKSTNTWVLAEVIRGNLSPVALELLFIAKKLAKETGDKVCAVLMTNDKKDFAQKLICHGADIVYVAEDKCLANFDEDIYSQLLTDMIKAHTPNIFVLPATSTGRSLSAKTAILADTGLTADATDLQIDKETKLLHATRPTFGGNLMATIMCEVKRPQMCSLRPLTYPQTECDKKRKGEIVNFKVDAKKYKSNVKFVSFKELEDNEIDICASEIIVAGGRGVKDEKGFALLKQLADSIGGTVAASRAAVDNGLMPYRCQVGLTGKTIKPKLYIACGISGQVQHMAGMSSSDVIVAINKDAEAPIMAQAKYALVGDVFEVIPQLISQLKSK
ncbi:MAG: electron transfer flavoprotein subunit alpha/FixB family protein [Elusimicrobiaceae bacterium]|jgi:electron transfer flavoprotein alpha subunit|nr:electron transfer flavoprotein subunit alpha/FixB family protein [Elusimicrobiaceae bacterium]MBT3955423.1 electron transfer flavoprotein subunit alpha/FixB family protein [Elusimicrobiaceae bacterium]MBT4007700.1 electron transfer flavoprotein subunit alpha/FixB family protein [Elusimicrobiaceae bacterium]MBT4402446.1 electron transfer flavoprotein subunit alpha/FixB family protein [Elusimicrobiaceae bacterium]MBT4439844.1 electron transfer flavoprotein subunit alpha/FixB family protein [El